MTSTTLEQIDIDELELFAELPEPEVSETRKPNPETHKIYAAVGEVALSDPTTIGQGRAITPERPYFTLRHQIRQAEARFIGGLSVRQRRALR
jgi:hypothetical protein